MDLTPDELRAALDTADLVDLRGLAEALASDGADDAEIQRIHWRLRKRRAGGWTAGIPEPVVNLRGPHWTRAQVDAMIRDGIAEDARKKRDGGTD